MPRGQPDFGAQAPRTTVGGLSDMGELAARLDSPVTFDRRGDVIWLDNFEGTEGMWELFGVGGDNAQELSGDTARSGMCSLKLTTGNTTGNTARMIGYLPYPVLSKIGIEISFTMNGSLSQYLWRYRLYDGTNYYQAQLRYNSTTKVWDIDDNGTWRTIRTEGLLSTLYLFNTVKMVIDFVANKYVRLILNESEYDISAYSLVETASGTASHIRARIEITTGVNFNHSAYFDDFIVTQNEP